MLLKFQRDSKSFFTLQILTPVKVRAATPEYCTCAREDTFDVHVHVHVCRPYSHSRGRTRAVVATQGQAQTKEARKGRGTDHEWTMAERGRFMPGIYCGVSELCIQPYLCSVRTATISQPRFLVALHLLFFLLLSSPMSA